MKKYLWPIIIVIILILAIVFYSLGQSGKTSDQSSTSAPKTENSLFTSIKDAMSKSLSLKCEYQVEGVKTTTYIKGGMVRVMTESADAETGNGNAIIKDNKMWVWTEGDSEGFTLELVEEDFVEEPGTEAPSDQTSKEDVIEEIEKYKDSCSSATVADSMFTPPSDITFSDLSQFQDQLMEEINATNAPLDEMEY